MKGLTVVTAIAWQIPLRISLFLCTLILPGLLFNVPLLDDSMARDLVNGVVVETPPLWNGLFAVYIVYSVSQCGGIWANLAMLSWTSTSSNQSTTISGAILRWRRRFSNAFSNKSSIDDRDEGPGSKFIWLSVACVVIHLAFLGTTAMLAGLAWKYYFPPPSVYVSLGQPTAQQRVIRRCLVSCMALGWLIACAVISLVVTALVRFYTGRRSNRAIDKLAHGRLAIIPHHPMFGS